MDRGAIGSYMTEKVLRTYMLDWNEEFISRLKDARIDTDLYGRFVEDKTIVTPGGVLGSRMKKTLKFILPNSHLQ